MNRNALSKKKRKIAEKSKEDAMLDEAMSVLAKKPDAVFRSKYCTYIRINPQQTYKRINEIYYLRASDPSTVW